MTARFDWQRDCRGFPAESTVRELLAEVDGCWVTREDCDAAARDILRDWPFVSPPPDSVVAGMIESLNGAADRLGVLSPLAAEVTLTATVGAVTWALSCDRNGRVEVLQDGEPDFSGVYRPETGTVYAPPTVYGDDGECPYALMEALLAAVRCAAQGEP